ncbi:MAG: dihydrofolate reductase [Planctomycetota bacterium]
MIIISAMTKNRVIGSGDGMPWDIPAEYQQYLDFTAGQTIIMGRKSIEIFGPDLTTDHAVVLTRSGEVDVEIADGCTMEIADSLDQAISLAESHGKTVFCGGGANVYEQALPKAEAMYLSVIKGAYHGDTHFPEFDQADWQIAEEQDHPEFHFYRYVRA